ncbi:hypothetical protein Nepgr_021207 [Nepenthes gracilis]|uniref:Uncharacterized protein n=1 Tax=Nepenthes gracilis TaxID=150966 RepID=A0AAD3XX47_NEPGR|nr:hypothetical protein Nepgr_021207 [Nepenthes gracilis]
MDRVISPRPEKISRTEKVTVERKLENSGSAEAVKVERITKQQKQAYSVKRPSTVSNTPPKLSSMIKCNDSNRDRLRELLFEVLSKVSSEANESIREEVDACDPIQVAISVESTMFEKWGSSILGLWNLPERISPEWISGEVFRSGKCRAADVRSTRGPAETGEDFQRASSEVEMQSVISGDRIARVAK